MTTDGGERSFGAPRFDVVLRGYDRRQVDEHLSRLQRVLSRMRSDLEAARGRPPVPPQGGPQGPARPRPTPRPRPDEGQDVVGTFTERMHTILQAAEEEAAQIRARAQAAARGEQERLASARSTARAEEETARTSLTDLQRQRDAVLADLTRMRGQLEALLSGPTARLPMPAQTTASAARDAGAGHPLPGTPASQPAAGGAAGAPSPAESTSVVAAPDPGRSGSTASGSPAWDRAGSDRAGSDRAGSDRAGSDRAAAAQDEVGSRRDAEPDDGRGRPSRAAAPRHPLFDSPGPDEPAVAQTTLAPAARGATAPAGSPAERTLVVGSVSAVGVPDDGADPAAGGDGAAGSGPDPTVKVRGVGHPTSTAARGTPPDGPDDRAARPAEPASVSRIL